MDQNRCFSDFRRVPWCSGDQTDFTFRSQRPLVLKIDFWRKILAVTTRHPRSRKWIGIDGFSIPGEFPRCSGDQNDFTFRSQRPLVFKGLSQNLQGKEYWKVNTVRIWFVLSRPGRGLHSPTPNSQVRDALLTKIRNLKTLDACTRIQKIFS